MDICIQQRQWRYNNPKPIGHSSEVLGGTLIAIQSHLRKQEKAQVKSNITPKATREGITDKAQSY